MTFAEAIRGGFGVIHRQWQLVAVHAVMMVVNLVIFFLLVGIPFVIALIAFGIDFASLAHSQNFIGSVHSPVELLTKYLGLVVVVLVSFLLYIAVATTIWLYIYGGTAGTIGKTVLDASLKFSMSGFFSEAKRLFVPLMWYFLLIGLIFIAVLAVMLFLGAGIAVVVTFAKTQDSTLALFLGIFSGMVFALAALFAVFASLALTVYGVAALFFKGEGAVKSVSGAFRFLWNNQRAFWLYILLSIGYLAASFIMFLIVYPFQLIPFIGIVISFPIRILISIVQGYLGLVVFAVIFVYYYGEEIEDTLTAGRPAGQTISGESSPPGDISVPEAPAQEALPPLKDGKEQT